MPAKKPRSAVLAALRRASLDEDSAVAFMERHRWGNSPSCPRCSDHNVYQMSDAKTGQRNKDHRWRCRACKKMHTVRTGTVMEESRLPLRAWCYAFWRACASKKGVSAMQIHRETEISYKSALYLMHRIRYAMGQELDPRDKLKGTVEADETFDGGKPRHRRPGKAGRRRFHVRGKTGPRAIPMSRDVEAALRELRKLQIRRGHNEGHVFLDDSSTPVEDPSRAFSSAVRRAAIGRHVRIHDLRHTALTDLAKKGVPPSVIQKIAGHSSLQVTSLYANPDEDYVVAEFRRAYSS